MTETSLHRKLAAAFKAFGPVDVIVEGHKMSGNLTATSARYLAQEALDVVRGHITGALADVYVTVADDDGLVLSGASGITPESRVTRAKGKVLLPGDLADLLLDGTAGRLADKDERRRGPWAEALAPVHACCEHAPVSLAASELAVMDKVTALLRPYSQRKRRRVLRWVRDYLLDLDEPPF